METFDLEHHIASLSRNIIIWAALILALLVFLSIVLKDRQPKLKPWLFSGLVTSLVAPTLFLIGSTIYLNVRSDSGGPVHWHAEVEFWACGSELELRDPTGFLSNKIGTSTYHEHDDKHIHLEGVVVHKDVDASLGKFMRVTGGTLENNTLSVPLNESKNTWLAKGDKLDGDPQGTFTATQLEEFVHHSPDGPVTKFMSGISCDNTLSSKKTPPAVVQAFVYKLNEDKKTYTQKKLTNIAEYVISGESSLGPPSDCVIFEYDVAKNRTDKLCEQYGIRDKNRCEEFGVKKKTDELCNIYEVDARGRKI